MMSPPVTLRLGNRGPLGKKLSVLDVARWWGKRMGHRLEFRVCDQQGRKKPSVWLDREQAIVLLAMVQMFVIDTASPFPSEFPKAEWK